MRFHLGSLAFGSLLVALVQLVRLLFEWVDQQTKRLHQGSETAKVRVRLRVRVRVSVRLWVSFRVKVGRPSPQPRP